MKFKNMNFKKLISVCSCIILCLIMVSACTSNDIRKIDSSIAMIKNATMSTYGTGFAVGKPGEKVDTIITSYSVVATANGVAPRSAEVVINESEKNLMANVVFYDAGRNVAVLKLSEGSEELKPVILKSGVDYTRNVFVRGYDGTGNIMSDFDTFNTTDIVQYSGNISAYDEINTMVVYKYSNEFNRAMVGAPAIDDDGKMIGMCAYSLDSMNTYSQYVLSSDELCKMLSAQEIDFVTTDEIMYKNIIIFSVVGGLLILGAVIALTLLYVKKENNPDTRDRYIKVTDGKLKGKTYKFHGKSVIGTDKSKCDIVLPDDEPGVSGVHCTVQMIDGVCYLVDNFSQSGTFLEDGKKVESKYPHKIEGNKIAFYIGDGKNRFEFIN